MNVKMGKFNLSLLVLVALISLSLGWESGTQYEYKYVGRSAVGIHKLKQQSAVIELRSRVIVQSIDQETLTVKLADSRLKRNGKFLGNPSFNSENGHPNEIEGEEDKIVNSEVLSTPFLISHKKGSITGIKINAEEPLWIVNLKKSIASQLQLDITGVRPDGDVSSWSAPKDGENTMFKVYEDSVTGDCSTTITISQLRQSQIVSSAAFALSSFNDVCKGKPVYQIVKTKDLNNCKTNPTWHSTTSNVYTCDFDKANCGDFLKRTSVYKYVACGDNFSKLTVVQASGYSDLVAQPFAIKTDELVNSVITNWSLEKKEKISSQISLDPTLKQHKDLSYIHEDIEHLYQNGNQAHTDLSAAYLKSPVSVLTLHKNILNSLRSIERDLKERPDSEKDNLERLAVISRSVLSFSLDELRSLWQEVKSQNVVIQTLFVDCAVVAGSNPSVMLIKELIETEQLTGHKANFALSALGYYVKTPTRELLYELVNLLKSSSVRSSKTTTQIGLMTVADLMNIACSSRFSAAKRFAVNTLGDFCNSQESVIVHEFLPLLTEELESSQSVFDKIVALAAFGSLGVEEVVPILLPVIRGTPGKFDDTAERLRAILSLQRVVFTAPQKIHPILASLAANIGERPEIRMASIGMLLLSNAPQSVFQQLAASTWFEPSIQVGSFVHTLVHSLATAPASTALFEQLSQKARVVLPNVKPVPFGLPFSMADIRSSNMDEGITVMMHTITHRDSDQSWPVYLSNSYYYQLGPLNRKPFTVTMWNFNMADVWQNIYSKLFAGLNPKYSALWNEKKGGEKNGILKGIWENLNVAAKPADKRAGFLHINLLGSINRFINLEKLDQMIPNYLAESIKHKNKPYEVSITKYRMLGEYNIRYATDLGLPMSYLFTLPMFASMQGHIKSNDENSCKSDISAELSWKLTGEIRVDIPFSGNYIATGVDVLVDSHAPKELTYDYTNADFKIIWTPDSKVTDLVYYHVKPYTISRHGIESVKPTLEDQAVNLISITTKPIRRELPLGDMIGVNVKYIEESELAHSDKMSWVQYLAKWDINSWANMGFAPLDIRNRKYVLRYNPSGTRARSVSSAFFYQYAAKTNKNTLVFETGSNQLRKPSSPEIVSYKPIVSEFRPLLGRLTESLPSGNARLMRASLTSEQKDGTIVNFKSVFGISMNDRYTKDLTDWQVEYTTAAPNKEKETKFAICYTAVRNWNNPPTFGFSKDVLEFTEEDDIGFGPKCERKVKFTAKVYRDEEAARVAIESPAGQQCLKDMKAGFKHGSPACTEARRLDHLYNNYELLSEVENMSDSWLQWARSHTTWMNQLLEPFIVSHTHAQNNTPLRASWNTKRNPHTGDSDMIFVRPHETVVAKDVRWRDEWPRFSPLSFAYAQVYYPLYAGSNFIIDSLNLTSGGVSESKCYVGSDGVYTFDGAHYKYTVDGCPHVLLTDCHKKSELAILAKKGNEGQKIVTVIYGKDTFELDPLNYIVVNGIKTTLKDIEKGNHIEIRSPGAKSITVVIFPLADGGIILDIRSLQFFFKVQGSHVELSAPVHLRGRTCGLCGDFNQEIEDEFKSPDRCTLSSGNLMAASFKLKSDQDCSAANSDTEVLLRQETENCKSVDQHFHTYLPDYAY